MARRATVLTKPSPAGGRLFEFDCIFDEPHPSYSVCNCYTTPSWAELNPSFQPKELQIGNKVILHESETIERSDKANLFWIDRIEKC